MRSEDQQTFLQSMYFFSWMGLNDDKKWKKNALCNGKIYFVQPFILTFPKNLCTVSISKAALHLYIFN